MNHRRQSSLSRLKSIANRFTIRDYLLPCIVKPKILILRVYYKVLIFGNVILGKTMAMHHSSSTQMLAFLFAIQPESKNCSPLDVTQVIPRSALSYPKETSRGAITNT